MRWKISNLESFEGNRRVPTSGDLRNLARRLVRSREIAQAEGRLRRLVEAIATGRATEAVSTELEREEGKKILGCFCLGYPKSTGNLAIALPVSVFVRQESIIGSGLDVSLPVDCTGGNRMLARRRSRPLEAPEFPRKLPVPAAGHRGGNPRSVIDADFDSVDSPAPGCPFDLVMLTS
jgi:hypothetical protein